MHEKQRTIVATFNAHPEAEDAVKEVQKAGFDIKKFSIIGRDYHSALFSIPDTGPILVAGPIVSWIIGKILAIFNIHPDVENAGMEVQKTGFAMKKLSIVGKDDHSAFFFIPGIGPILVTGPLVSWIIGALERGVAAGELDVVGTALFSLGIPKDSIVRYEISLRENKFLLIAHGSFTEVGHVRKILATTKAVGTIVHPEAVSGSFIVAGAATHGT